jgi:predicted permease
MTLLDTLVRDVRYGLRMLRKSPGFAATAILTLGLAIGANTAVFSLVDAVLLRPLPYPDSDRLALVSLSVSSDRGVSEDTSHDGQTWETFRDHITSADVAVFSALASSVTLATTQTAVRVEQQRVGAGFFRVLGVAPAIGREFSAEEDRPGGPTLAVLSQALRERTFPDGADVTGRTILLRGEPHTVIGVMPSGFHSGIRADVWTPLQPSTRGEGGGDNYQIAARLKPGVSWERAADEAASIGGSVVSRMRWRPGVTGRFSVVPMQRGLTDDQRRPLVLLWGAASIVALIACVNIAGLLLARSAGRAREIVTRVALGAGRAAVIRQLMVESLMLALGGAAVGLLVATLSLDALHGLARDALDVWQPAAIDVRVLGWLLVGTVGASVIFGLAPALQASRVELKGLTLGDTRVAGTSSRWPRLLLVALQVAMGVVLLVGAALLVRSLLHLRGLQPGFDPRNVVAASVSLQDARYRTAARVNDLFDRSLRRIREIPGIEAATVSLGLPYERILNSGFRIAGPGGPTPFHTTNLTYAMPGYFETLRIPLRRGRTLRDTDTAASPNVVVVNETFAQTYLRESDPIGRRLRIGGQEREIVGLAGDVLQRPGFGSGSPIRPTPVVYMPASQISDPQLTLVHTWFSPVWIVRTPAPPDAIAQALRRAMAEVDPQLPFGAFRRMSDVQSLSLARQRFLTAIVTMLAAAAVVLAIIGLHGLIASAVVERTRELGIRMALGSTAGQALRAVVVPALVLSAAGIAAGSALALGAARLLRAFVWGISATDPMTFLAAGTLLFVVVSIASVVPALKVLRLDPATTLRHE